LYILPQQAEGYWEVARVLLVGYNQAKRGAYIISRWRTRREAAMTKTERFVWIIIYLNIPLWIAVLVLVCLKQWEISRWLATGNVIVLGVGFCLHSQQMSRWHTQENHSEKDENNG
jgi:hypothetical protein